MKIILWVMFVMILILSVAVGFLSYKIMDMSNSFPYSNVAQVDFDQYASGIDQKVQDIESLVSSSATNLQSISDKQQEDF